MARPKKAKVEYFPHSVHHGKTLYILENKFGNDGYAFWFKLLELLGDTNHHYFDCNSTSSWEFLLAKTSVSGDIATEILNILAEMKAIDDELWGKKIIWSENFIANLDTVYSRREINPYNKQDIKDKCIKKLPVSGVSDNINPQSKVKESKVKKSKEEDVSSTETSDSSLIKTFGKEFKKTFGVEYHASFGKDGKLLKNLEKHYGKKSVEDGIRYFFRRYIQHEKFAKKRPDVGMMSMMWNGMIATANKESIELSEYEEWANG